MPRPIIFGEIDGIEEGHLFDDRKQMMPSSFHRKWGGGIDGNPKEGASAIVLSGGYEDDSDDGDVIVYTGAGGRNKKGKWVKDQSWDNTGNAALLTSEDKGYPIRVIRGSKHKSEFSPSRGYQYVGLYRIDASWQEKGKSGFNICRYRLVYCGAYLPKIRTHNIRLGEHVSSEKKRVKTSLFRVVRDTEKAKAIKDLYDFKCQVCSLAIKTKNGFYAEAAHIKPLGKPHNGDDNFNNLLCLCPNHHVMFDKGTFSIDDNFNLLGLQSTKLLVKDEHSIDVENFKYHREIHGYTSKDELK